MYNKNVISILESSFSEYDNVEDSISDNGEQFVDTGIQEFYATHLPLQSFWKTEGIKQPPKQSPGALLQQ